MLQGDSPFVGSLEVLKGKGVCILLRQALSGIPGAAAPALQPPVPGKPIPGRHVRRRVNLQSQGLNWHIQQVLKEQRKQCESGLALTQHALGADVLAIHTASHVSCKTWRVLARDKTGPQHTCSGERMTGKAVTCDLPHQETQHHPVQPAAAS